MRQIVIFSHCPGVYGTSIYFYSGSTSHNSILFPLWILSAIIRYTASHFWLSEHAQENFLSVSVAPASDEHSVNEPANLTQFTRCTKGQLWLNISHCPSAQYLANFSLMAILLVRKLSSPVIQINNSKSTHNNHNIV